VDTTRTLGLNGLSRSFCEEELTIKLMSLTNDEERIASTPKATIDDLSTVHIAAWPQHRGVGSLKIGINSHYH
jgi:hypothetical protein